MPLVPAKCPECGGNVVVDSEKDAWICDFCKTPFIVEKAINHFNMVNNITNNIINNNDIKADVVNVYEDKGKNFIIKAGELVEYKGESEHVVIPDVVKTIRQTAFNDAPGINSISLGKGLVKLSTNEESLYKSDYEMKNVISSSLSAGKGLFKNCYNLKRIEINENTTHIGCFVFANCKSIKEIVLHDQLQEIEHFAFANCESLEKIVIPEGVKKIGDYAFSECKSLVEIVLPDSLESLGNHAFWGTESLRNVTGLKQNTVEGKSVFVGSNLIKYFAAVDNEIRNLVEESENARKGVLEYSNVVFPTLKYPLEEKLKNEKFEVHYLETTNSKLIGFFEKKTRMSAAKKNIVSLEMQIKEYDEKYKKLVKKSNDLTEIIERKVQEIVCKK